MENRAYTVGELTRLGFRVLPSCANFIFASSERIDGLSFYTELRKRGILVRHFNKDRIANWCRISIGTRESMEALIRAAQDILGEKA